MFIDQFLLMDQSIVTWVQSTFPSLLVGRTTQLLVATPLRRFAEVTTGRLIDNETLLLPRITITKLDPSNDPARFNSNKIRRLGWDGAQHKAIKAGRFPAPVNFEYQIDFWTKKVAEMNLWEQKILWDFAPQYIYLQIRPDDVWQNKKFIVFLASAIADNSEYEPGADADRAIRKTMTIRAEARIYDQELSVVPVVKRFELQWLDYDTSDQFDRQFLPPLDLIATGDGFTFAFGPIALPRKPVLKYTVVVQTVINTTNELAQDNGSGVISGTRTTGSIDYATGIINLTFSAPPDSGAQITTTFFTDVEA